VSAEVDYPGLLRLDGRGFVVLGAGQGMGREAARALAGAGARVVCVDTVPERAAAVASEIDGVAWVGDMTDRATVQRLVADAAAALGRIHGLVDVIGMSRYTAITDTDDAEWAWHQDIVLRHVWLSLQLFGRAMSATGGGTMAFVASASAITGAPMHAAYGAAKAALMSLVRSAAVELGPARIRVNAVAPGVVWTPRVAEYLGEPGRRRNAANVPLGRVALPADIAASLLFLSSDLSSYVNGQTLLVDGGVGSKFPYPPPELAGRSA
jgi:NAD(P)-dependent dehydrogenase (short-subunit alcohol dehydrogenase family)